MAADTFTIGELLNRLAFIVEGQNTPNTVLRPNYLSALQESMNEIVRACELRTFMTQATLSFSVAGGGDYNLEDDYDKLLSPSMVYTANPQEVVRMVPPDQFDMLGLEQAYGTTTGKPRIFTIRGVPSGSSNVEFIVHPTPDATYAVRYYYFARPANFEGDTDGSTVVDRRFPEHFKYGIIFAAALDWFASRISPREAQIYEKKRRSILNDIRAWNEPATNYLYKRMKHSSAHLSRSPQPADRWDGTSTTPWQNPA